MPTTYTRLLGSLRWQDALDHLFATTPANTTWIVRDFVIANVGSTEDSYSLAIIPPTGDGRILFRGKVGPNTTAHVDLRQVMNAGDQLQVLCGLAGGGFVTVTGYVFSS